MKVIEIILGVILIIICFASLIIQCKFLYKIIEQYEGLYLLIIFMIFMLGVCFLLDGIEMIRVG